MKKVIKYTLPVTLLIIGGIAYMTLAEGDSNGLSTADKTFLLEAADTRMMDWAEGDLATEKTKSDKYRQYGRRLMRDQDMLIKEIKVIAESKNITLPSEISEERTEELNRLKATSDKTFERRFRRMIIRDHKRDIQQFKQASESTDPEIRDFAKRFLGLMEEHLQLARDLNK